MTRRIEALEIMKILQALLQGGIIEPKTAQNAVKEYINGDSNLLKGICLNPDIPMEYEPVLKGLRRYINF